MKPTRAAIIASPVFIALFQKARARMRNPKQKLCKRMHRICAANADVGHLCRANLYSCYPCWLAINKKWRKSKRGLAWRNGLYARTSAKAAQHAVRAAKLGISGRWKPAEFLTLCEKYNNRCLSCGKHEVLSPDHVIPFSLGGLNVIENIQPLCLSCNCVKHTSTTDYRKNPHPNCLKASKRCKPKQMKLLKPAPPVSSATIEAELGIA